MEKVKSKKNILFIIFSMALIVIDQAIKMLVYKHLIDGSEIILIKGFLSLTYVENTGRSIWYSIRKYNNIYFIYSTFGWNIVVVFYKKEKRNK